VLFLSVFTTSSSGGDGAAGVNVLFGSVFGLSASQAAVAAGIGLAVCVVVVLIARPLLFASLDEAVAVAHGLPVQALGIGFLALVGVCAAEATQAVGALLLLGLLAAPAGAAQRLTYRPYVAFWLSGALAVVAVWLGIILSYLVPDIPPSFATMAVATATYGAALAWGHRRDRLGREGGSPGNV
jgi:zinc/manganese transport system permease protein